MKPIKSCVATGVLNSAIFMTSAIIPAVLSTISIKPTELKYLLGSCGTDYVYYYACGALNDSNETCGALGFIETLRS